MCVIFWFFFFVYLHSCLNYFQLWSIYSNNFENEVNRGVRYWWSLPAHTFNYNLIRQSSVEQQLFLSLFPLHLKCIFLLSTHFLKFKLHRGVCVFLYCCWLPLQRYIPCQELMLFIHPQLSLFKFIDFHDG